MDVAFCDKDYAIKIIKQCLEKLGFPAMSGIPDLARNLSKYPKNPKVLPAPVVFAAKDSGLTTFLAIFISRLEGSTIYEHPNFEEIINNIRWLVNEGDISPSDWKKIVEDFISDNWNKLDKKSRHELVDAWRAARVLSCKVILGLLSPKEELRRFSGYTKGT